MRIAIPVQEQDLKGKVSDSFGRTRYFLIYDTKSESAVFLDNSAAAATGGAGIVAAQAVVDNKVEALLTPRCGENAAKVIQAAGIEIFKTGSVVVQDNIKAFLDGNLLPLDEIHAGNHGHGG